MLFAAFSAEDHASRDHAKAAVDDLSAEGFAVKNISVVSKHKDLFEDSGAATGAVVGGLIGLLAGAAFFPPFGFLIGGPLFAMLTGMTTGGLIGALVDLGMEESDAERYQEIVGSGGVMLMVQVKDAAEEKRARSILEKHDADEVTIVEESEEHQAASRKHAASAA